MGLDVMLTSAISPIGAVITDKFMEWVTAKQRDKAQIMKQGRLFREEQAASAKREQGKGRGKGKEQEPHP